MSATGTVFESESESESIAVRPLARTEILEKLAWGVILFSQLPLLLLHFRRLWLYDHYHYFPFVIAAFVFFAWQRWPAEVDAVRDARPKTRMALAIISWVLFAISTFFWSAWLSAVAAIFSVAAAVVHFGGKEAQRQLTSAWLLLWFLLPIPFGWDVQLIFELQTVASNAASYLLDFFGVNHLLSGHVLEVPGHEFLVEEACSGIHSLFALLTFAGILAIALRRTWLQAGLLLTVAVFWATSINIIRITTVVVAFSWFGVDLATEWRHEMLGLVLNGCALVMLYCSDQFIMFFLERPDSSSGDFFLPDFYEDDLAEGDDEAESADRSQWLSASTTAGVARSRAADQRSRWRFSFALASIFGILGALQSAAMVMKYDARRVAGEASSRLTGAFDAATLPTQFGAWKQVGFEHEARNMTSIQGSHNAAWRYQSENASAIVHINYPFLGWHNLPGCFEAQGWQVKAFERTSQPSLADTDAGAWKLELDQPDGSVMHVRFCQFDSAGEPVLPAAEWKMASWLKTVFDNSAGQWSGLGVDSSTYQVVMQVTPKDRTSKIPPVEMTAEFLKLREQLVATVLKRLRSDD